MTISPFTPLFFDLSKADGIESDYIQTFSTTDKILLELICGKNESCIVQILDGITLAPLQQVSLTAWAMNDTTTLRFTVLSFNPGLYIINVSGKRCEPFRVTDNPLELENTTLIQYSMKNNKQRNDAVFFINRMQYFFDWRVPGGFKDSDWTFGVENEQFVTDTADIMQLYALDSIQQKFTLGNSQGCPVWFAALLNRLLCCTYVYFDGVRYARKESSTPEMNVQLEGVNSFVFTQNLQRVINLDPVIEERNHLIMRRVNNTDYRQISTNNNRKI
ncbi:MAG: hypothetical protein NC453_14110 [Muribaculum sp.]|nr:hypothetical protein [Muribaculum sp.]